MPTWTLQHASTTQSLAAWGFSGCVLSDKGWVASTFQFTHDGAAFDAAPIFAKDATITLRLDGVVQFIGFITQTPAHTGEGEDQSYVAENLLGDLSRRVFGQTWQNLTAGVVGDGYSARAVLFDSDGEGQTVALALADIVNAAATAGVAVQMGSAANLTVSPRKIDVQSMTFLECLRAACVYSPDVCPQVDYSTTPPTLNFIRRGDATAHNMPVIETADDFKIEPLYDQQTEGVHLVYETRGTLAGRNYLSLRYDIYPPETPATGRRVLFAIQTLQGASQAANSQTSVQSIATTAVDEDDIDWWRERVPYLASANEDAIMTGVEVLDEDGSATTVDRELRTGVIYPWMGGTNKVVVITGIFNGLIGGVPRINQPITIRMVSTSLTTGEYSQTVESTPAAPELDELPPPGLAAHLYSALNPLQWRGSRLLVAAECAAPVRVGDVANFTGTAREDWATAAAQIQEVECRIDSGETLITFGRPEYLAPQDFIELLREQRKLGAGNSSATKETGESSGGGNVITEGPTWTADTSVTVGASTPTHPWMITKLGTEGNIFRVEGGLYSGVGIEAQTVDIGGTRPLYIFISCKWTVTAHAAKFAASVARTGAPTIASTTTAGTESTMVLPTGETTVKSLLGVVGTGDIVYQWETWNISPVWEDNGTFLGEALRVSNMP